MENETTLTSSCAGFISRCQARNLSIGTVGWYNGILRTLKQFLSARGTQRLSEITPADLRDFLVHLRERGHAAETVARTFGALRCAFRFWTREGLLSKDPMALVEKPRRERVLIRPMTAEQASALLEQPDRSSVEGLRDRAMMMLMLDCGLRVSELRFIDTDRIDWPNCTLSVMGKGRKERQVPFSPKTREALLEYATARRTRVVRSPQFFVGQTGQPVDRSKLRKLVRGYGKQAGIQGVRISPHTLRHTFAVLYIRGGGDSFSLQEILGHSTLDMTRQYVHLARTDISDQHRKYSPISALLGGS